MGKTALALAWAEAHDAEILSCDALLVYRGMDVGTAKPTAVEQARVRHHGIDVVDVSQPFSVRGYVELAKAAVERIHARGRRVLIAGGSGFYLKSFFASVADDLEVPEAVSAEAARVLDQKGLEGALVRLRQLSPSGLGIVDVRNPRRVLKALERCLASGLSVPELEAAHAAKPPPFAAYEKRLVLLERDDADLKQRIHERTQVMLRQGLVGEVRALLERGVLQNPSATRAVGYRETIDWLERGSSDATALVEAIEFNTWRLVRKQRTWFRRQVPIERTLRLAADTPTDAASLFGG